MTEADGWVAMDNWPALPVVAVAENVTGDPGTSPASATAPWAPAAGPSVRWALAVPSAPVELVAGVTVPPPVADQATTIPATGFPWASVALTTSGLASVVPAGAVCASPEASWNLAAVPADTVAVKDAASWVEPTTLAWTLWVPACVPRTQRAAARPVLSVTAVSGSVRPPPASAVKATRICATGRLVASVTRTASDSGRMPPATPL